MDKTPVTGLLIGTKSGTVRALKRPKLGLSDLAILRYSSAGYSEIKSTSDRWLQKNKWVRTPCPNPLPFEPA